MTLQYDYFKVIQSKKINTLRIYKKLQPNSYHSWAQYIQFGGVGIQARKFSGIVSKNPNWRNFFLYRSTPKKTETEENKSWKYNLE